MFPLLVNLLAVAFASESCPSGADVTSLLTHQSPRVALSRGTRPLWMSEVFTDFTLRDLACQGKPSEGFTRECWGSSFDRFDRNGDGIISAEDVQVLESETTKKNLTRADVRAGIAVACQWYPEEAMKLIVHEPLITALVFDDTGIDQLPPPPPPPFVLPSQGTRVLQVLPASPVNDTSLMLIEAEDSEKCVQGAVQVSVGCLGLAFGILGLELPSGAIVADMVTTNQRALNAILDIVRNLNGLDDMTKNAMSVKDILAVLYNEGILSDLVKESLKDMNWWQWSKTVAQISMTVALWFVPGAGQAGFVLQVSLALMDAWDVIEGLRDVKNYCGQDNGGGGETGNPGGNTGGGGETGNPGVNTGGGGKKWRRRGPGQKVLHHVSTCWQCGREWCHTFWQDEFGLANKPGYKVGSTLAEWGCDKVHYGTKSVHDKTTGDVYAMNV
ncbi:unnamed protein product [Durusdinium trenchii]|uniref:Uncharacterized protein n=2 Tax=Durusdinium trenchii TaxID=1381693 RepID=A0ABP0KVS8_9DINO